MLHSFFFLVKRGKSAFAKSGEYDGCGSDKTLFFGEKLTSSEERLATGCITVVKNTFLRALQILGLSPYVLPSNALKCHSKTF